jgi:hypothetical protein
MNPTYYNAFTTWFDAIWKEYDLLIAAGCVGLLALIGLAIVCMLYIIWLFGEILEVD